MQSITKKAGAITILGIIIGAIAGYAYYHYIGFSSGTSSLCTTAWLTAVATVPATAI